MQEEILSTSVNRLSSMLDAAEELQSNINFTLKHLLALPEPSPSVQAMIKSLEEPCKLLAAYGEAIQEAFLEISDLERFMPVDLGDYHIVTVPTDEYEEAIRCSV